MINYKANRFQFYNQKTVLNTMRQNIINDYEFRNDPQPASPRFGSSYANEATTGTQKIEITKTANQIVTKEASSYHNPVTGVSEKIKTETRKKNRLTNRGLNSSESISSSSSSDNEIVEDRNFLVEEYRVAQAAKNDPISLIDLDLQPVTYQPNYVPPTISVSPLSNPVVNEPILVTKTEVVTYEPVQTTTTYEPIIEKSDSLITQNTTSAPLSNTGNLVNISLNDPQGLARTSGYTKTSGHVTKTKEVIKYIDPETGVEKTAVIKTKSKDKRQMLPKEKQGYDYKVEQTPDGPNTLIKQTRREGGKLRNLKNKVQNMINRA